jgi:long-chain acyl-CoA synthetase
MDINHDLVHSLQKISAIIRDNNKVVIFPEGARSRDGKLAPFKKTFSIVAKELKIPVVPAVIRGAYDLMPINVKFPRKGKVSVEFLQPIEPQNNDAHSILESTRNMISIKCDTLD